jgi:hypothetical protein
MKFVIPLLIMLLSACATQKSTPVVDHSIQIEKPVVRSRAGGCEQTGGPSSSRCR